MLWLTKDRSKSRIKNLPHGQLPLRMCVRKRRFHCAEAACPRRSLTETSGQLPARSQLRPACARRSALRQALTNRAMSEVGSGYGVAWWTVHRVLVAAAADVLGPAKPTPAIGTDETRATRHDTPIWSTAPAPPTAGSCTLPSLEIIANALCPRWQDRPPTDDAAALLSDGGSAVYKPTGLPDGTLASVELGGQTITSNQTAASAPAAVTAIGVLAGITQATRRDPS